MDHDEPVNLAEIGVAEIPSHSDFGIWRIGKPSEKLGVTIFMRIATTQDTGNDSLNGTGASGNSHISNEELRQNNIKLRKPIQSR